MRGIVDESTGVVVARWLRSLGHDVLSIREDRPRMMDEDILTLAVRDGRVVITNDKDFGDLVFRDGRAHRGVILLRLVDDRTSSKIAALERLFEGFPEDSEECSVVVTERSIRVTRGQR
jgi:predicted nuclease of predicted toxin-antitoxin system